MMLRLLIIPGALASALFPKLASELAWSGHEGRLLYRKSVKIIVLTMSPICLLMAVGSYWGLALWINSEFAAESWAIVSILSVGILCNSIAFVPFATIQAAGNARLTALANILVVILYIPTLLLLVHQYRSEEHTSELQSLMRIPYAVFVLKKKNQL